MRRPPPPSPVAAPPRRQSAGPTAAPPRRPAAGGTGGVPRRPTPGPASRPVSHSTRVGRRSVAVAAILTAVILLAYGGYALYQHTFVSDSTSLPSGNGFVASVTRANGDAQFAIASGLAVHLTGQLKPFSIDMNSRIADVRTERAHLEQLATRTAPPRADTLRAAIGSMIALETAMTHWRDTIFQLRFGNVDTAQTAIEQAVNELQHDIDTWQAQKG